MEITGGCYCKKIRYTFQGDVAAAMQCHCRECQYITGGNPNVLVLITEKDLSYTSGEENIASFTRDDIPDAVTRLFCSNCGTSLGTKPPRLAGSIALKVGTIDDPSFFSPSVAIFTKDMQSFHHIPDDLPSFEATPG